MLLRGADRCGTTHLQQEFSFAPQILAYPCSSVVSSPFEEGLFQTRKLDTEATENTKKEESILRVSLRPLCSHLCALCAKFRRV
jgi:hypothetical protein